MGEAAPLWITATADIMHDRKPFHCDSQDMIHLKNQLLYAYQLCYISTCV